MTSFNFTIQLVENNIDDEGVNKLYEAGCDDGLVYEQGGKAYIEFDREAENEDEAYFSAKANIEAAGFNVETHYMEVDQQELDL